MYNPLLKAIATDRRRCYWSRCYMYTATDIIFSNGQFDGSTFSNGQSIVIRTFSNRQSIELNQIGKKNKSWTEGIADDQTLAIPYITYIEVMTFKSDHIIHTLIHVSNKYIIYVISLNIKLVT